LLGPFFADTWALCGRCCRRRLSYTPPPPAEARTYGVTVRVPLELDFGRSPRLPVSRLVFRDDPGVQRTWDDLPRDALDFFFTAETPYSCPFSPIFNTSDDVTR
jgi:hypothetical protein